MSDRREIRSSSFYRDVNASSCIDARLRVLILSHVSTKSVVLPNIDSMIWIAHTNLSWPPSSPQYDFRYSSLPDTILPPWIY